MTPVEFIARQMRRRRRGKVVPPVVDPRTWRHYPVTTPYNKPSPIGRPWILGRHTGEDHACPIGSLAVACTWGRVVCVAVWTRPGVIGGLGPVRQWGDSYGTHVVIRTADGRFDYAYCHLSEALVRPGQRVRPGQIIGHTGNTGGSGSFGAHLHLEARPAGGRFGSDVNPIRIKRKVPQ